MKVTCEKVSSSRVGGGTTNIGGGSSSEQDHGTKTWPDGDAKGSKETI